LIPNIFIFGVMADDQHTALGFATTIEDDPREATNGAKVIRGGCLKRPVQGTLLGLPN
jgi:hypothetical protein